jgi:thiamine pyrophosphate-dependent acetolactate synthase large subunit-like protein
MKRFDCLKLLASMIDPKTIVVANVGPISREWNALRPSDANLLQVNFGLCAAVGLGISVSLPHRKVVLLDGDGNLLLNLASLADMANQNLGNTVHIVLDNDAYEGGGGLRSATAGKADLSVIARGAGVPDTKVVTTLEEFESQARLSVNSPGHHFLVTKVEKGSIANLPTLTLDGKEAKYRFARYIESTEGVQILRPRYTHI